MRPFTTGRVGPVQSKGASIVELMLALPLVVALVLVTIDVARVIWIQSVVRAGLVETAKQAQARPAVIQNVWNNPRFSEEYAAFAPARAEAVEQGFVRFLAQYRLSIALAPVEHHDIFSDGSEETPELPIAYLPPGYRGVVSDWGVAAYNSHKCSLSSGRTIGSGTELPTGGAGGECPPANRINPSVDSLSMLSTVYPTELKAFYEVSTIVLGRRKLTTTIAFYPAGGQFSARPTVTPTPSPSPTTAPSPTPSPTPFPTPLPTATVVASSTTPPVQPTLPSRTSTPSVAPTSRATTPPTIAPTAAPTKGSAPSTPVYQLSTTDDMFDDNTSVLSTTALPCLNDILQRCKSDNKVGRLSNETDDCVARALNPSVSLASPFPDRYTYIDSSCNVIPDYTGSYSDVIELKFSTLR